MPEDFLETWLPVIGRALAVLCLNHVENKSPERVDSVIKKVKFLESLGLPRVDAAEAAGSNPESVRVMIAKAGGKRRGKNTKKRKS